MLRHLSEVTAFATLLNMLIDCTRTAWTSADIITDLKASGDWIVNLADDGIRVREAGAPEYQSIPLALTASSDEILALLQGGRRVRRPRFDVVIQPGLFLPRQLAPPGGRRFVRRGIWPSSTFWLRRRSTRPGAYCLCRERGAGLLLPCRENQDARGRPGSGPPGWRYRSSLFSC